MRIDVFSIFPEFFVGPLDASLLGRARAEGLVDVRLHDPRDQATDRHRTVDDTPYGGGAGMVMMAEPLFAAVEAVQPPRPLFLLSASGRRLDQQLARDLAAGGGFSLLCGRYEGVDQRVADHLCDDELSVGDYVLAGGEAAALVVIDAVVRLVPGVMGNAGSEAGRPARVPAVHPPRRAARPSGARGAAQR
jgi:tRNA (guanine37-N1)-methyltransferase